MVRLILWLIVLSLVLAERAQALDASLVKDIYEGSTSSNIFFLGAYDDVLFFRARDRHCEDGVCVGHGRELWMINSTTDEARMVKDLAPVNSDPRPGIRKFNDKFYFLCSSSSNPSLHLQSLIFETDLTEGGTKPVVNVTEFGDTFVSAYPLVVFKNKLLFASRRFLFKSDGTQSGTLRINGVMLPNNPGGFIEYKDEMYFRVASSVVASAQGTVFKTNGADAGTYKLFDQPHVASRDAFRFVKVRDELAFVGTDNSNTDPSQEAQEVWVMNETHVPRQVTHISNSTVTLTNLTEFSGYLYFIIDDHTDNWDSSTLWRLDTLNDDLGPVQTGGIDIHPCSPFKAPGYILQKCGDKLCFPATDGSTGCELYMNDGSLAGSELAWDLNYGPKSSYPKYMVESHGKVFVAAYDNTSSVHQNLWWVDIGGGEAGTVNETTPFTKVDRGIWAQKNKVYFHASNGGGGGEPWVIKFNQKPVAVCKDVTANVTGNCENYDDFTDMVDDGSHDPDNDIVSRELDFQGPFPRGVSPVELTVTDSIGNSDKCSAEIIIEDTETLEPDEIDCDTLCDGSSVIIPKYRTDNKKPNGCGVATTFVDSIECKRCHYQKKGNKLMSGQCNVTRVDSDKALRIYAAPLGTIIETEVKVCDTPLNCITKKCSYCLRKSSECTEHVTADHFYPNLRGLKPNQDKDKGKTCPVDWNPAEDTFSTTHPDCQ